MQGPGVVSVSARPLGTSSLRLRERVDCPLSLALYFFFISLSCIYSGRTWGMLSKEKYT